MVGTEINPVKISTLFAQSGFHRFIGLFDFFPAYKTFGYHRLIGDDNAQIAGSVDFGNGLGNARQQFEIHRPRIFIHININNPVPVKKNGRPFVFAIQAADLAAFDIRTDFWQPVFGSHILDIFGRMISLNGLTGDEQTRQNVFSKIGSNTRLNIIQHPGRKYINGGIDQIMIDQTFRMRLGQHGGNRLFGIGFNQIAVIRVIVRVNQNGAD